MSSPKHNEIDAVDREILLLITKGNPSPYSIWSTMNKQLQGKGMAYINIKKRIRRLVEMGLLLGIKPDTAVATMRGRKDYMVTPIGLDALMPDTDVISREDFKTIIDYMGTGCAVLKKNGTYPYQENRQLFFGIVLLDKFTAVYALLSEYLKYVGRPDLIPIKPTQIDDLKTELMELASLPNPFIKPKPQEIEDIDDMVKTQKASKPSRKSQSQFEHYDYSRFEDYPTLENAFSTAMAARSNKNENILEAMNRIGYQTSRLPKKIQVTLLKQAQEYDMEEKMEKSKSTRVNPIPTNRSKSAVSQKKKR